MSFYNFSAKKRQANPLSVEDTRTLRELIASGEEPDAVKLIKIAPYWGEMEDFEKEWILSHLSEDGDCLDVLVEELEEIAPVVIKKGIERVQKKLQSKSSMSMTKFNAPFADFSQLDLGGFDYHRVVDGYEEMVEQAKLLLNIPNRPNKGTVGQMRTLTISKSDLSYCSFWEANLTKPRFLNSTFEGSFADDSHFFRASLNSCDFTGSSMERCIFVLSNFVKCTLNGVNFRDSIFVISGAEGVSEAKQSCFDNCVFFGSHYPAEYSWFEEIDFEGSSFKKVRLGLSFFERCNFSGADFRGAVVLSREPDELNEMRGAYFHQCDFSGADFRGADFSEVTWEDVKLNDIVYDEDTKFPPGLDPKKPSTWLAPLRRENPRPVKKKRGLKSGDPRTPAPLKDRVYGSFRNKPGSASTPNAKIDFGPRMNKMVSDWVEEQNKNASKTKLKYKVTLGQLKSVCRRGMGAYSKSHRPGVTREGWCRGRIRAFLYLLENGKPKNPRYVQDNDLLPEGHPAKKRTSNPIDQDLYAYFREILHNEDVGSLLEFWRELCREGKDFDKAEKMLIKDVFGPGLTGEFAEFQGRDDFPAMIRHWWEMHRNDEQFSEIVQDFFDEEYLCGYDFFSDLGRRQEAFNRWYREVYSPEVTSVVDLNLYPGQRFPCSLDLRGVSFQKAVEEATALDILHIKSYSFTRFSGRAFGADLSGVRFESVQFGDFSGQRHNRKDCSFLTLFTEQRDRDPSEPLIYGLSFWNANLRYARFSGLERGIEFYGGSFMDCDLTAASFKNIVFNDTGFLDNSYYDTIFDDVVFAISDEEVAEDHSMGREDFRRVQGNYRIEGIRQSHLLPRGYRERQSNPAEGLPFTTRTEKYTRGQDDVAYFDFETGVPVTFPATHRKQKTAYFGSRFGQDIEPDGRYVNFGHYGTPGKITEPGNHVVETIHDTITFENPLVIVHGSTTGRQGSWKRALFDHYQKTGNSLSKAIVEDGYDGIVTVGEYGLSEIVDLTSFLPRTRKKNPRRSRSRQEAYPAKKRKKNPMSSRFYPEFRHALAEEDFHSVVDIYRKIGTFDEVETEMIDSVFGCGLDFFSGLESRQRAFEEWYRSTEFFLFLNEEPDFAGMTFEEILAMRKFCDLDLRGVSTRSFPNDLREGPGGLLLITNVQFRNSAFGADFTGTMFNLCRFGTGDGEEVDYRYLRYDRGTSHPIVDYFSFGSCDFFDLDLSHSRFERAHFIGCSIQDMKFQRSVFLDVGFEICRFLEVKWDGSRFDDGGVQFQDPMNEYSEPIQMGSALENTTGTYQVVVTGEGTTERRDTDIRSRRMSRESRQQNPRKKTSEPRDVIFVAAGMIESAFSTKAGETKAKGFLKKLHARYEPYLISSMPYEEVDALWREKHLYRYFRDFYTSDSRTDYGWLKGRKWFFLADTGRRTRFVSEWMKRLNKVQKGGRFEKIDSSTLAPRLLNPLVVGTDTATVYGIAPEQLQHLIEDGDWQRLWESHKFQEAHQLLRKYGGDFDETGSDGGYLYERMRGPQKRKRR